MDFRRLTLDCIDTLRPYFTDNKYRLCDFTIGGTFMWREYHNTEYAIEDGRLYLKVSHPEMAFTPPQGAEPNRESYERIIGYCSAKGVPAKLCAVSEAALQGILEMFPGSNARTDRNWSDYLYLSRDLADLAGRKYSGQRNHINRFMREYPTWSFERVAERGEKAHQIRAFYEKYAREHVKDSPAYIEGEIKAIEALDNRDAYRLFGGVLYVGGDIVGVSFGEIVGDTLFVHIEKADTAYHGAYPMLLNQFARMFAAEKTEYINREEDDGVEGLRTSKLSYHPTALLDKYIVEFSEAF